MLDASHKQKSIVVSGFPGIGKTHFSNSLRNAKDCESSAFPKTGFPLNYIGAIKNMMGRHDYILVTSHDTVRQSLVEQKIEFILVYLSTCQRRDYVERYKARQYGRVYTFYGFELEKFYPAM